MVAPLGSVPVTGNVTSAVTSIQKPMVSFSSVRSLGVPAPYPFHCPPAGELMKVRTSA